jgi:GntR family transcriptional regulator
MRELKEYFNIKVEAKSALPVYEQVKRAIKLAILSGRLEQGDQLMSIRELALKLQINPNTIIKVYYQLEVEGFVNSRPGAGYYVKFDRKKMQREKLEIFEKVTGDYVSKALDLGYSFEDIVNEISKKMNKDIQVIRGDKDDNS